MSEFFVKTGGKTLFPGKTKIFLNGRIVTAKKAWWIILTTSLISFPPVMFLIFMYPSFWPRHNELIVSFPVVPRRP